MNLIPYLVLSTACLAASYCAFRLLLKKETMFVQQRIFLVSAIVLSGILPFTHFRIDLAEKTTAASQNFTLSMPGGSIPEQGTVSSVQDQIGGILLYIYAGVTIIILAVSLVQVFRVFLLYIISERSSVGNLIILRSKRLRSPFSFFSLIFIPLSLPDEEETRSIFIHESIHARQYHSIDNIILGMACAIMWFNPVIWIMKRRVHLVHEYLADEGALQSGIEKLRYQALLVNSTAEEKLISIPSRFNNNLLKKRIIMMQNSKMKDSYRIRLFSIIPLPVILILTVSLLNGLFPERLNAQKQEKKKDNLKEVTVVGYGKPQEKNSGDNIITVVGHKMEHDTLNYIVDGLRVSRIDDINPDSIESMNVMKEDRTIIIRTKSYVRSGYKNMLNLMTKNGPEKILYILDGKKITDAELKNLDPNTIESINVIKSNKEEIRKYTSEDYDGVVIITSKKK